MRHLFLLIVVTASLFLAPLAGSAEGSEEDWGVFVNGTVYVMPSSHQDIGWENTPTIMTCLRASCLMKEQVLPLLEDTEKDYAFTVEEILSLMELKDSLTTGEGYITQEEFSKIIAYSRESNPRLRWGALYNQPYESTLSGEQLVRVTYLGRKWLKDNYPGADSTVAHNVDVPSTAWQFPQILSKAGITSLVIYRFDEGLYEWESPDGSSVILYANGKYDGTINRFAWRQTENVWNLITDYSHFAEASVYNPDTQKNVNPLVCHCYASCSDCNTVLDVPFWLAASSYDTNIRTNDVNFWNDKYGTYGISSEAPLPLYFITDANCALDFSTPIENWDTYKESYDYLPTIQHATTQDFMEAIAEEPGLNLPTVSGERPNIWLYIHGPGHHKALSYQRESGVYLPAAETFATIDAVLEDSISNYPTGFETAWREGLYPDVGWGGLNGTTTDEVFAAKVQSARNTGLSLLNTSLENIVKRISPDNSPNETSKPIVVFNTLAWVRTAPVFLEVEEDIDTFYITDIAGETINYQSAPQLDPSNATSGMNRIVFIATDVPSMGYATYYLISGAPSTSANPATSTPTEGDNILYDNYTITLGDGGLTRLYDRVFEKEIIDSTYFPAGDVISMFSTKYYYSDGTTHYHGTGAGEFSVMDQPVFDGDADYNPILDGYYKKTSDEDAAWQVASGPVKDVYTATYTLQPAVSPDYPGERYQPTSCSAECLQVDVTQKISIYKTVKKIDFEIALEKWNQDGSGATCNEACNYNKEFRMALPLQITEDESRIFYEVPMGVLEFGVNDLEKDAVSDTPANVPGGWAREWNPMTSSYQTNRYTQASEDIHLREIQNFMTAANSTIGVTMSSSVAVADWKDIYHPTASNPSVIMQPLLLASRRSCHGDDDDLGYYGNWFIQTGDHYFSFSLLSHGVGSGYAGWENGYKYGVSPNNPLIGVIQTETVDTPNLPESYSFLSVTSDDDNVIVTAFKKAEGTGNGDIILRMVELQGKQTSVTVSIPFTDIVSVYPTNLIEEIVPGTAPVGNVTETSMTVTVDPYSIETYSIAHKSFPHSHTGGGGCSLIVRGQHFHYLSLLFITLAILMTSRFTVIKRLK